MVDNSQGHCAYAADALMASCMYLGPGRKQARMRNGWYFDSNGNKVIQKMVFPPEHSDFPDQPKGIKQVLIERGLWENSLAVKCKKCPDTVTNCCAR